MRYLERNRVNAAFPWLFPLLALAHFLLIGLTGVVATRYAAAMGPLLAVCGVLTASWILGHVQAPGAWGSWSKAAQRGGG